MGRLRFVQPQTVRLPLTDGDYIDIKSELNAGEERAVFVRQVKSFEAGSQPQLDPSQVEIATILGYLLGWSFVDAQGTPVEVNEDTVRALDGDTFTEIFKAIDAHEKALAAEKKSRAAGTASSPTSSSPGA